MVMKEIRRADGMFIRYQEKGTGSPPMVFVHGMGGDHRMVAPLVEYYKGRYRVIAPDGRGCGGSAKPEGDYSVDTLADDLRWLCEELGIERPVVAGRSLGGSVCLNYAVRYPERVRGVVLMDSGIRDRAEKAADLSGFYDALGGPDHVAGQKAYAEQRLRDPGDDPEIAAGVMDVWAQVPPHAFVAMGRGVLAFDSRAAAAACTVPALLILSDRPYTAPATVEWLAQRPNWQIGKVVGSGHGITLMVPQQVIAMIDRFLEILDFPAAPSDGRGGTPAAV